MIPVDKHKALRSLPEEKLRAVEQMMRRGESGMDIAAAIQAWGFLKLMPAETLKKSIIRYRTDLVRDVISESLSGRGLLDKVSGLTKQVDILDELQRLYLVQQARIQKLMMAEDGLTGEVLQISQQRRLALSEELALAINMSKEITKIHLETGIIRRAPKNMQMTTDEKGVVNFRVTQESFKALEAFVTETGEYEVSGA